MLVLCLTSATAQRWGEDLHIEMWSNMDAPHSNNLTGDVTLDNNMVGNVTQAELFIYQPSRENNSGVAVVICPGGGYKFLSMMNGGQLIGEWFARNGITAAVLQYRQPNGVREVPFEDGVEALRVVRQRSRQLGVDPSKVGILGFSAGGHLAASISILADRDVKPDFSVLFYPVISSEKGLAHEGSFNNLLGSDRTAEMSAEYSLERRIDEETPPAILFHCSDDKSVPSVNSTLYYSKLSEYDGRCALYIFPVGGHGWGNRAGFEYQSQWQMLLLDWIERLYK